MTWGETVVFNNDHKKSVRENLDVLKSPDHFKLQLELLPPAAGDEVPESPAAFQW